MAVHVRRGGLRTVRVLVVAVLVPALLALLSGCFLLRDDKDAAKPELTAWERVMAMTAPDGSVTRDMALTAFATVYGPLPGVSAAKGSRDGLWSGSAALRWITAYWSELTPPQQSAVAKLTGRDVPPGIAAARGQSPTKPPTPTAPDDPGGAGTPRGTATRTARGAPSAAPDAKVPDPASCPPANPPNGPMEALLNDLWQKIAPLLRLDKDIHIAGCMSAAPRVEADGPSAGQPQPDALADAWGWYSGKTGQCVVTSYPAMRKAEITPAIVAEIFVHELGHCAEGMILNDAYASPKVPSWVLEGFPNWMVGRVTGRFSFSGWWTDYLTGNPSTLTAQSYGAMGFWAELEYLGVDVWTQGREAIEVSSRGGTVAAFAAAIRGHEDQVLDSWPASLVRAPERGRAWDMTAPGITGDKAKPLSALTADTGTDGVETDAYEATILYLDVEAEVVRFSVGATTNGYPQGRFGPNGGGDFPLSQALPGGTVFCTKGALCTCPDDSPKTGTEFAVIAYGRSIVAFTGGSDAATLKWTSQTLKEYCGEPKDKKPDPVPISGGSPNGAAGPHGPTSPPAACKDCKTGSTHGDPHVATFDGAFYDLQSAGEFTLTASLDDALLVQTRQQPLGTSASVGVNTATSANVAGDRIGFSLKPRGGGIEVRVNGKSTTPAAGETKLPGGGVLTRFGDAAHPGYSATWPDGSTLYVTETNAEALKVDMAVAASRRGRLNGLLGNADGNPANDLDAGGERILPPSGAAYEDLHGAFADHWRVKPDESLFDYAPGQSTATFTDKTFPSTRTDPGTLPRRADAEAQCRAAGVTAKAQLDACILDVAVTGKREYAEAAAVQQQFTESAGGTPGTGDGSGGVPVDPVCLKGKDGPKTLTMVVQVGETVRTGGTGALLCGGYLPAGDWRHHLLVSDKAGKTVRFTRAGDADCRLQWTVYKASVGGTPTVPKISVCQDLGTITLAPDTVYIVVVDKPDPAVEGRYGLTVR